MQRSRLLTLVGMALAVSTIAAAAMRSASPRLVLSAPDTIAVGDTVTVSATAFDASGQRVPGAHIVWQVNPSAGVVLADSATNGQTARLTDTSASATELIAVWVDSSFVPPLTLSSPRIATAVRSMVFVPAIVQPPVVTHATIYGSITLDPVKGLVLDSTAWRTMTAGATRTSCLYVVAWSASNAVITGRPIHWSIADTTIAKFDSSGLACPDTTVDPAVVARQGFAVPGSGSGAHQSS